MTVQTRTATVNLLEDTPTAMKPQVLLQVEIFMKGEASPTLYLSTMYTTFPLLSTTVWAQDALRVQGQVEMRLINEAFDALDAAQTARAGGDTKNTKPAELYRRYAHHLRKIQQFSQDQDCELLAQEALQDLFLAQSLSPGELESPDYMDGYTGEFLEDDEFDFELGSMADIVAKMEMASPAQDELYRRALQLKQDLGWDDATMNQFIRAQSATDMSEEELFAEDRGYVPPTMERDIQIDASAFTTAAPAMAEFSRWRTETFEMMKTQGTDGMTWKKCFLTRKQESVAAADLIVAIANVAMYHDITSAAAVAFKVLGEYGLDDEDLDGIGGFTTHGVHYELNYYMDVWGDDVLEIMQDGLSGGFPMSDIEATDENTMIELSSLLPEKHHNPMQTRSFVMAYIAAIATGAELVTAENSAIAAWREAMSPQGAEAYRQAWHTLKNKSQAWRAFWQKCGPDVPRPKEQVRAVRGNFTGLVLASGRKIDWRITAIKMQNDELDMPEEQKGRLKALLLEKNMKTNPVLQLL